MLGLLVAYIASAHHSGYFLGKLFPLAFASVGCAIALAASLVRRLGMRRLSHSALVAHSGLSAALAMLGAAMPLPLWLALGGVATIGKRRKNYRAVANA